MSDCSAVTIEDWEVPYANGDSQTVSITEDDVPVAVGELFEKLVLTVKERYSDPDEQNVFQNTFDIALEDMETAATVSASDTTRGPQTYVYDIKAIGRGSEPDKTLVRGNFIISPVATQGVGSE